MHPISSSRSQLTDAVTEAVLDPSVAALLIAKASQAAELGVELRVAPESSLPVLDGELSADVATVVGNLVDNAMDAASPSAQPWVEVALGLVDGEIDIVVRDSGPGVAPGMEKEVFRRGVSTKADSLTGGLTGSTLDIGPDGLARERGIGLSLVHLVCTRRGGEVTASSSGVSTFTARMPAEPELISS